MAQLQFERVSNAGTETRTFHANNLVVAGWTGRDQAALQHHIDELASLGVAPPSRTPIFYRCGVDLVTQTEHLQVLGHQTSGEIEYVLLAFEDGLWVTVGSDHTDREAETMGVALSKQLAGKVLGRTCWPLSEMLARWDDFTLKSWATINGERILYQDGTFAMIQPPAALMQGFAAADTLATGTVMMSGTPPAIGGIRPASRFEMELMCPATGRVLQHEYTIEALDVVL
ncbi:MAG: DUF2848 domain-containing protein [Pseudomonadota bacterium]